MASDLGPAPRLDAFFFACSPKRFGLEKMREVPLGSFVEIDERRSFAFDHENHL